MEVILDGGWAHNPVTGVFIRGRTERFAHTELREDEHVKVEAEMQLSGHKLRGLQKLKEQRNDPPLEYQKQHGPHDPLISHFWAPGL